jgi:serine/threonine protein kinase
MCANQHVSSPVRVGDIVAAKYRVDAVLGQGGMGVVVAATDTILDRRVAVKFLLPQYSSNEVASGRFLREARATARLNSEHAVRIIEVGQLDNGSPFMAMEFLQGVDLGTTIEQQGALDVKTAVDYVLQAARGLAEAHKAGIIHRDVKPSNLFLSYQPSGKPIVKVLDFGVSKLNLGVEASGSLTTTGQTLGSPLYMSPEQMRSSQNADGRSDIWGLGVVLFELLTGARPFTADSLTELVLVINQEPPLDPKVLRPDLPDALCRVVLRCLEKDPNRRYPTISAFADDLAAFGSRDSRAAAKEIRGMQSPNVKLPGAPPLGRLGTLIVDPNDHPGLAHSLQGGALAQSNVGPSSSLSDPHAQANLHANPAVPGSMTSAPWASTSGGVPMPTPPTVKKSSLTGLLVGLGLAAGLVVLGSVGVYLWSNSKKPDDSAIVSAASDLAESTPRDKPHSDILAGPSATPTPEVTASPSGAATLAADVKPLDTASQSGVPAESSAPATPSPGDGEKKKLPRRRPAEEPKSAKDRLGF